MRPGKGVQAWNCDNVLAVIMQQECAVAISVAEGIGGASPPVRSSQPNGDLKGSRDEGAAPTALRRGVAATVAGNCMVTAWPAAYSPLDASAVSGG